MLHCSRNLYVSRFALGLIINSDKIYTVLYIVVVMKTIITKTGILEDEDEVHLGEGLSLSRARKYGYLYTFFKFIKYV